MSDDKTQRGGQDRARISLSDDYEVRDWARKFGVTPEQLKAAVAAVGNQASAVEAYLKAGR
jgi:transposase-like protein